MDREIASIIAEAKLKYNTLYLIDTSYFSGVASSYMVIRPLTRREFNLYIPLLDKEPDEIIPTILDKCVIYPDKIPDHYLAGIDSSICRAIVNVSGFLKEEDLAKAVIEYRGYAASLEARLTMYICKAFPSISPDQVDNMDFQEIIKLASLAEQMIGNEIPYNDFLNPKKPKKKRKPSERNILPPPKQGQESFQSTQEVTESNITVTKENFWEAQKQLSDILGEDG